MRCLTIALTSLFLLISNVMVDQAKCKPIEVQGKLNSQVFAIGGETTGFTITTKEGTLELDFARNNELRTLARKLHQKQVAVTGELTTREGVERGTRKIVVVATLKPAGKGGDKPGNPASKKQTYLTADGSLKHALTLKDAQGGFAGFSGHLITIEPDGTWQRQPFLNQNVRAAERKGKFAKAHLATLAAHLSKNNLAGLPKQIGKPLGANPHIYTITFGDTQSILTMQPGARLPAPDKQNADPDLPIGAAVDDHGDVPRDDL